jgi:hypothetical protein
MHPQNTFLARYRQLKVLEAMKPLVTVIRAKKGGENVSKIPGWMEICWSPQGIRQEGSTTAGLKLCMAVSR